ncbi:MAG: protease inhibitor I42 family protein, partial [Acidobacteriota bacterium]|nr:protease inhibitor I42 family protein [Acidobacteriota bacterium]
MRTRVTLAIGEETTFSLPVSGSNGYTWCRSLDGSTEAISLSVSGKPAAEESGTPNAPKASGGTQLLLIHAENPGLASVHLELKRPWLKNAPALEEQWIDVEV